MMKTYQPITVDKQQVINKIKNSDYLNSFANFARNHQLPNTGNVTMTLQQLSTLLTGDTILGQFDIIEGKVLSFLNDTQVGFLNVNKLFDDIVVGCIIGDTYDADDGEEYDSWALNELQFHLDSIYDNGFNEYLLTIGGRHRVVGMLTICKILGIDPRVVEIRVSIRTYERFEDAALAILCNNKSRSMTPAERTNCLVNSKGIDTTSVASLAKHASTGIKNAKEAFSLAAANLVDSTLTKNTLATASKSYVTELGKTKNGKKVISYLSDPNMLRALLDVFVLELTDISNTDFNVSRNAASIGTQLARQFHEHGASINELVIQKMTDVKTNSKTEGNVDSEEESESLEGADCSF